MSESARGPGGPVERLQATATRVAEWVMALPPVATLTKVLETYNSAAGGLLAAGLAYGALITLLLAFLLFGGLLGFVIADAAARAEAIRQLSELIPILAPIVSDGIDTLIASAGAASIIGLIGLAWAVSGFYGSLDHAFAQIFRRAQRRSMVRRLIRGLLSVGLLIGAFAGALVLTAAQQVADAGLPDDPSGDGLRIVLRVGVPLISIAVVTAVVAVIYRLVPNVRVPYRALLPPALIVGIVLALMTELFVFVAPRLVGALSVYGAFGAVFAALAWLSLGFQALLIGAAWTRARVRARDPGSLPPTEAEVAHASQRDAPAEPREPLPPPPPGVPPAPAPDLPE